jgi:hypothetical protein
MRWEPARGRLAIQPDRKLWGFKGLNKVSSTSIGPSDMV